MHRRPYTCITMSLLKNLCMNIYVEQKLSIGKQQGQEEKTNIVHKMKYNAGRLNPNVLVIFPDTNCYEPPPDYCFTCFIMIQYSEFAYHVVNVYVRTHSTDGKDVYMRIVVTRCQAF